MSHLNKKLPVLVTGVSGYIATHCVYQLLEKGYSVRGTVRDINDKVRVDALRKLHPLASDDSEKGKLQLVNVDLLDGTGWDEAVKDVCAVLHLASPFPVGHIKKPDDVIQPAVQGVTHCLEACIKAKVRRVVMTSSIAAVKGGYPDSKYDTEFTEADWSIPEKQTSWYARSKTLAEMKAWEIVEASNKSIELVVINPALVFGPMMNAMVGRSSDIIRKLLTGQYPALPPLSYACVDVRDIAKAHINGMEGEASKVAGKRFLISDKTFTFAEISHILKDHLGPNGKDITPSSPGYRPTTLQLPLFIAKTVGFLDQEIGQISDELGKGCKVDASAAKKDLGFTAYRDAEKAIVDHAMSMIHLGLIKNRGVSQDKLDKCFYDE